METYETAARTTATPAGKPELYPARRPIAYQPEFCERVVALGSEGLSIVEIAVETGITRQTLYKWMEAHEEFEHAMERANVAALAYFERMEREGLLMGNQFNGALCRLIIQTRFPDEYGDAKDEPTKECPRVIQMVISEADARL